MNKSLAPCQLDEAQWREIREPVGLPDEARSPIESLIGAFQFFQRASDERLRPKDIREKLKGIANTSRELASRLLDIDHLTFHALLDHGFRQNDLGRVIAEDFSLLGEIPDHKMTLEMQRVTRTAMRGRVTPRRDALQLLDELYGRVDRMQNWASKAAESLPSEKPGRYQRANNNQWLVRQLDAILFRFTKLLVNNSGKGPTEYVRECFKVANSTIGKRAIEKAIARHVKARRTNTPTIAS
jgi:hypothetical protein